MGSGPLSVVCVPVSTHRLPAVGPLVIPKAKWFRGVRAGADPGWYGGGPRPRRPGGRRPGSWTGRPPQGKRPLKGLRVGPWARSRAVERRVLVGVLRRDGVNRLDATGRAMGAGPGQAGLLAEADDEFNADREENVTSRPCRESLVQNMDLPPAGRRRGAASKQRRCAPEPSTSCL